MLNKIMMSGRLLTEPAVTTKDDLRCCKVSIAVEQPKQKGVDTVETDTFTCLAFDDNASAVSFLYSKGGTITFVGSLRNAPDTMIMMELPKHDQWISPYRNTVFLNKKQTNPNRYGSDLSIVAPVTGLEPVTS